MLSQNLSVSAPKTRNHEPAASLNDSSIPSTSKELIMFDIYFNGTGKRYGETGYTGEIIIGSFSESFFSNNTFFNEKDYKNHWKKATEILIEKNKSYFLTMVYHPEKANFFMGWPCYHIKNIVYFQNQFFFDKQYCLRDLLSFNCGLEDIEFQDEDGNKIETWKTSFQSILDFNSK